MQIANSGRVQHRRWSYSAWCEATQTRPPRLYVRILWPIEEERGTTVAVIEGVEPPDGDRTWYNVWYAVCRRELNKYPLSQDLWRPSSRRARR